MKRTLLLAMVVIGLPAFALPTYEPFTEYAPLIATSGSNSVNLALSGYTLTNGPIIEQWGGGNSGFGLFFAGTAPASIKGNDVIVTNNASSVFTSAALANLLPSGFPGTGGNLDITAFIQSNATNAAYTVGAAYVGNSAVLKLSQDVVRPTSGVKTIYVSYLLNDVAAGGTGSGNDGRYCCFLSATNLYEGTGSGGAWLTWSTMFNTFNTSTAPKYYSHSYKVNDPAITGGFDTLPCDSSVANGNVSGNAGVGGIFNQPTFIVGAIVMNAVGSDTNIEWANPPTNTFGGANPPSGYNNAFKCTTVMPDIGGFCLIDRVGSGGSGGIGPTYIGNLLIGTTWSYVTGGPEFTNQPVSQTVAGLGGSVTFTGNAVAAGQSVNYQWVHINGTSTNVLTDGVGTAGGAATVTGSGSNSLTLSGVSAKDIVGVYQLVATASGTTFSLNSASATLILDPPITSSPANVTANYHTAATFTAKATTVEPSLSYQWYFGSTALVNGLQADGSTVYGASGTVNANSLTTTLTVSNVSYLDAGTYYVVVTNNVSNANLSSSAMLTVNDPILVKQPNQIPVVIPIGGSGTVSVTASGSPSLTYQWYGVASGQLSNGGDLSGTTTATLTINNAQAADADTYYCVVSGSASGQTVTSVSEPVYVESAAVGPFNQNEFPPTGAPTAPVEYVVWDPNMYGSMFSAFSPGPAWNNVLSIVASNSAAQTWTGISVGGGYGYEMTGTYLAMIDPYWMNYTNVPVIDILMNVYGNAGMYAANGSALATTLREGQTASPPLGCDYVHQGTFPAGGNNGQWNWVLLSFTNPPDGDGYRYVGDPTITSSGGQYGGANGATLDLYAGSGGFGAAPFIVRAIAVGPHGAFGSTNEVNQFAPPPPCTPEPSNNLAWIDFNLGTSNNLSVMNNSSLGETYTVVSGVGPANDRRTAILPSTSLMEMPILNNYLGYPCNEDLTMQVCFEVYDDPALAGNSFGPTTFASDDQGDQNNYTGPFYTFTGSGQWIKVCFFVGPVNLDGVNTAPLTGGPVIQFNAYPYIDRVEVGLIRTGTNALAGQIPDPNYHLNPFICDTNYGFFAEWNPTAGFTNNVVPVYGTGLAGPAGNQMICEVPQPASGGYYYEDWNLANSVFGPSYQDNADVIINVTYYDDPAIAGSGLFANYYSTMVDGNVGGISPSAPYDQVIYFQGSGQWRTAQFELPNVNFTQTTTSQHVCKFASSAPVYISGVQFNVLRPCGNYEGLDYLQTVGTSISHNAAININWRGQAAVVGAPTVNGPYTPLVSVTNILTNSYSPPITNGAEFFRLALPAYPAGSPGDAPPKSVP